MSYKFPAASVKPGSYVSLTACYTNFSTYDRPWRKPNAMDFRVRLQQLGSAVCVSCGLATAVRGMYDRPSAQCTLIMFTMRRQCAGLPIAASDRSASPASAGWEPLLPSSFAARRKARTAPTSLRPSCPHPPATPHGMYLRRSLTPLYTSALGSGPSRLTAPLSRPTMAGPRATGRCVSFWSASKLAH